MRFFCYVLNSYFRLMHKDYRPKMLKIMGLGTAKGSLGCLRGLRLTLASVSGNSALVSWWLRFDDLLLSQLITHALSAKTSVVGAASRPVPSPCAA